MLEYWEAFVVLFVSLLSSAVSTLVSYVMLYRKPEFWSKKRTIEIVSLEIMSLEREDNIEKRQKNKKRLEELKTKIKLISQRDTWGSIKSGAISWIAVLVLFSAFRGYFAGVVIAKLPFVPISLLKSFCQRGIISSDPRDFSYAFVMIMFTFLTRDLTKMLCPFPPRFNSTPKPFAVPEEEKD